MAPVKPATIQIGTRSTNGCWTCRLRRKKCDETHPSCHVCTGLRLDCQGYGPRPPWMDRGPREREEARKIKAKIARVRCKRGKYSSYSDSNRVIQQKDIQPSPSICQYHADTAGMTVGDCDDSLQSITLPDLSTDIALSEPSVWSIQESSWTPAAEKLCPTLPSVASPAYGSSEVQVGGSGEGDIPFIVNESAHQNAPSEGVEADILGGTELMPSSFTATIQAEDQQGSNDNRKTQRSHLSVAIRQSTGLSASPSPTHLFTPPRDCHGWIGHLPLSDAFFFSYYLTDVSKDQFPFSRIPDASDTQWLSFMLGSSEPVIRISIALSRMHHSKMMGAHQADHHYDDNTYKRWIKEARATFSSVIASTSILQEDKQEHMTLVACTLLLQTIFLETLYGTLSNEWQISLAQAGPYIKRLIAPAKRHTETSINSLSNSLVRVQMAAAKALLGHFLWFDILAAASCGTGPFLEVNHTDLLDSDTVDIPRVSGCSNGVAKVIWEISALQRWKKQAEEHGALSVMELANRAAVIYQLLNRDMASFTVCSGSTPSSQGGSGIIGKVADLWVTSSSYTTYKTVSLCFARAADVYLHVVVSGPNPLLPEIRTAIDELTGSFIDSGKDDILSFTSWPLCIAACLATDEEQRTLHAQFTKTRSLHPRLYTHISEAWSVAQRCRQLRDREGKHQDWVSAMEWIEQPILLV